MKKIKLDRKLNLNKTTISKLTNQEEIIGGISGKRCDNLTKNHWCKTRNEYTCKVSKKCATMVEISYCICIG